MINIFGALVLCLLTTAASCSFWDSCCNKTHDHHDKAHSHHNHSSETKTTEPEKKESIAENSSAIAHISNAQAFDDLLVQTTKPIIVKFEADWCGACKEIEPLFHALAQEFQNNYLFVAVDASKVPSLRNYYGIRAVPTIIFIKNGKEIAPDHRIIGVFSREDFVEFIKNNTTA
jgi:thioredoxin-like negative regulator of GroEL